MELAGGHTSVQRRTRTDIGAPTAGSDHDRRPSCGRARALQRVSVNGGAAALSGQAMSVSIWARDASFAAARPRRALLWLPPPAQGPENLADPRYQGNPGDRVPAGATLRLAWCRSRGRLQK